MLYFSPNRNLKGILNYLSKNKVLYERTVVANESSRNIASGWGTGNKILDLKSDKSILSNAWCSESIERQYVDIEFKTHYLKVKEFSIKTQQQNKKYTFSNFSLQGSNSSSNFVDIYLHDGTTVSPLNISTFRCQKIETYNHFRLQLLSKTENPVTWFFMIGAVEFFGHIENIYQHYTCKSKKYFHTNIIIYLVMINS